MSDDPLTQHDCCPDDAGEAQTGEVADHRSGLWTGGGAVAAAIGASACCWLPLLAVGLGFSLSLGSAIGFFEAVRPYLLGAAAIFLTAGFYRVYFRKGRCEPGAVCATGPFPRKAGRTTQRALWLSAGVVIAMVLFPYYSGALFGRSTPAPPSASTSAGAAVVDTERARQPTWVYKVEGMTCGGCEAAVCSALRQVSGVKKCGASYKEGRAWITVAEKRPDRRNVEKAIRDAGFSATSETK